MNKPIISHLKLDAIIFDFDGVLTNNKVYIDQNGNEMVQCSRGDGLAFNVLNKLNLPTYIISTEVNNVVKKRAKKLKVECFNGILNKEQFVKKLAIKKEFSLNKILYVGNDLNDYNVMKSCGYSACPVDSHHQIRKISKIVLNSRGGDNIVRELVEKIFNLNLLKVLYS